MFAAIYMHREITFAFEFSCFKTSFSSSLDMDKLYGVPTIDVLHYKIEGLMRKRYPENDHNSKHEMLSKYCVQIHLHYTKQLLLKKYSNASHSSNNTFSLPKIFLFPNKTYSGSSSYNC